MENLPVGARNVHKARRKMCTSLTTASSLVQSSMILPHWPLNVVIVCRPTSCVFISLLCLLIFQGLFLLFFPDPSFCFLSFPLPFSTISFFFFLFSLFPPFPPLFTFLFPFPSFFPSLISPILLIFTPDNTCPIRLLGGRSANGRRTPGYATDLSQYFIDKICPT